jgi:branched-chain amino acid transport system permease protein
MFLQQSFNGLTIGTTYALVAVGFSMVYGVLQLVNFANGAFYLLGVYVLLTFYSFMSQNFFLALIISVICTGALGAAMDSIILEPIRSRSKGSGVSSLIATLGVGTFIINLIILLYGSETKTFPEIFNLGKVYIGSAIVMWNQIIIAALSLIIMIILSIIVYKTKLGGAMRAISQNPSAAKLMGIPVNRIITVTFFIGTMCAAIAGSMVAMYYGAIDTTMYLAVNLKTFTSVVLGGVGSLPGAMLGGIIIGVLETFVAGYISSDYRDAVAFVILIIVLIFRPTGLFGQKNTDKV